MTRCLGCDSTALLELDSRAVPRGVASDAKPWPRSGEFVICGACGHTQKIMTEAWKADVAAIYGQYEMYSLAGGSEQMVFDAAQPMPRTRRLFQKLTERVAMADVGTMLDVGCSVGSTLRTFNSLFPRWQNAGFDITTHCEGLIKSTPGVTDFFTGSLTDIDRQFDLITMLFVVEHLPDPRQVLEQFRRLVKPEGIVWIHTSDFWANPFDLTVVDHSSHFMVDTLAELMERCGFTVIDRNDDWNIKEMGVIARWSDTPVLGKVDEAKKLRRLEGTPQRFHWLGDVVRQAHAAARGGKLAILGTSIAATWLASMVPDVLAMFVDEDQQRVNKTHLGVPVVKPGEAPGNIPVYLAFPPGQAMLIQARLKASYPHLQFVAPPALSA